MVYSYLRQTFRSSSLSMQQHSIVSYASQTGLSIDKEVLEYSNNSVKIDDRKNFESFIYSLGQEDTVIVYEIFSLSCYVEEMVKIINCMLTHNVTLYISKSVSMINRSTKLVDIVPMLSAPKTTRKENNSQQGRPKGSKSLSKFDAYRQDIVTMLASGKNVSAIAKELRLTRSSLKDYINSRELREFAQKEWTDILQAKSDISKGSENILLICPFEKNQKETM